MYLNCICNSSIFCTGWYIVLVCILLLCFNTVGWVIGMTAGLEKPVSGMGKVSFGVPGLA